MVNKVQAFTTNESTSSTQTLTVTLDNLDKVIQVTSNTGNVTYTLSGNELTLRFTGGSYSRRTSSDYWVSSHSKEVTVGMGNSVRGHRRTWNGSRWVGEMEIGRAHV